MAIVTIVFGERRRLIGLPESYDALIRKARAVFRIGDGELLVHLTRPAMEEEIELDSTAYEVLSDGCILRFQIDDTPSKCRDKSEPIVPRRSARKRTRREVLGQDDQEIPSFEPSPVEVQTRSGRHDNNESIVPRRNASKRIVREVRGRLDQERSSFLVKVITLTGGVYEVRGSPTTTIDELKHQIHLSCGPPAEEIRLIFAGRQLEDYRTLSEYCITSGCMVELVLRLRGGKPAIYLMSPGQLNNAFVCVTLSRHWEFSTVYPLAVPALGSGKQSSVGWHVSADPNGILKDKATGFECSYLYWEAKTTLEVPASPSISSKYPFNPQSPNLSRDGSNACILPFPDFIPYLERTLTKLTLSPAMRTEFMVYWLPKFQGIRDRGLDIAFDFVHQAAFDKVAKLSVDPQPKTVARIFLLFDGVPKDGGEGLSRAELDAIDWPAKIGMDADGMRDEGTFRVLEWGGMEAREL